MTQDAAAPAQGSIHRALTDAVVRTLREMTGRGATSARAVINQDVAMVILYDSLTKGESMLVERGHSDEVLRLRGAFQHAMADDVVRSVEQVLARRVVAFMSTNHIDPNYSVEIFMLGDALDDAVDGGERDSPSERG